ncbi:acyl-CoA dehydrogenase family protein [Catellatospora methionotrophica]|uniref:acyl-CoA dehydrogenase family protein n=1 Tax=Catellatospora methionotrophica TaxID=121620 RepID=UPI0033D3702C
MPGLTIHLPAVGGYAHAAAILQAIQLKAADMAMTVQPSRLPVHGAAPRADAGHRVDLEAGMAKAHASEAAVDCAPLAGNGAIG